MRTRRSVVSGGTGGIGASVVRRLVQRGDDVEGWFLTNTQARDELLASVAELPGTLRFERVDVTDPVAVRDAASRIGDIDLFVHAAGALPRPAEWDKISAEDVRKTVDVNLVSAIWVGREFGYRMALAGTGHMVFLHSSYALGAGAAAALAYTAAKSGLTALTRALAAELGKSGVRVNAVAPSNVDTRMTRSAGQAVLDWAISTTPVGRLAEPTEIAGLIYFLDESEYITGDIVVIDGGQTLMI